jgi:hypothetical protein
MSDQLAEVAMRNGYFFISSYSQTTDGFWTRNNDILTCTVTSSEDYLGEVVLATLTHSRVNIATPPQQSRRPDPLLKAAGVGSYSEFMKRTRIVQVERTNDQLTVTPTRNLGSREGFAPLDHKQLTVTIENPRVVGNAILRAFDDAL